MMADQGERAGLLLAWQRLQGRPMAQWPVQAQFGAALLLAAGGAHAQSMSPGEGLLPVARAFALKTTIDKPGTIALHFDIAPDYYLYRGRIEAKILTAGVTAGAIDLPVLALLPYVTTGQELSVRKRRRLLEAGGWLAIAGTFAALTWVLQLWKYVL